MSPHLLWRAPRALALPLLAALLLPAVSVKPRPAVAQDVPPAVLDEAVRRTGLSREELMRRYAEGGSPAPAVPADGQASTPPGRTESAPGAPATGGAAVVVVPPTALVATAAAEPLAGRTGPREGFFGADFFRLDSGLFGPSSFGPVPEDYLVGVGDQVVVDVWGDVELRLERVVDRDGTIILPKGGRIACWNRTLKQVDEAVKEALSRSYSGIASGTTLVSVSLGTLRAIRVFVVGDAVRPGAFELSGVSTIFGALYAAGGPSAAGSWRDIRLMRGSEAVASLDIYRYLLEGKREHDAILREGDTVFIPPRGTTVNLRGAVRRPLTFELKAGEDLADLLRFGGGFQTTAATERVHLERIVPPAQRRAEQPDRETRDILLDPATGAPAAGADASLRDGDVVTVGAIADRLENWVAVAGNVKRPGRYEWRAGMDAAALIAAAGGLWGDTLGDRAVIDRTLPDETHATLGFVLGDLMSGAAPPVPLQPRDQLRVYSIWDVQERYEVAISGEVRTPTACEYRAGMTLRDLILKAGGLRDSADMLKAELFRVRLDAVSSTDPGTPPASTVDRIEIPLREDYLKDEASFPLQPHDRVAIRKLPWWELQRTVTLVGEVMYPGVYALDRPEERLSELLARAGGLKPNAFVAGARVTRARDGAGNVAIDLANILDHPGSAHDIVLEPGDELLVPGVQYTVKVSGLVGSPTSLVYRDGLSVGDYVSRSGGYADGADKWKTRIVYPNGLSRPIRKVWRDPPVMPGSTIVVPLKPPHEDKKLETLKDIATILASVATMYLVIDRTAN